MYGNSGAFQIEMEWRVTYGPASDPKTYDYLLRFLVENSHLSSKFLFFVFFPTNPNYDVFRVSGLPQREKELIN